MAMSADAGRPPAPGATAPQAQMLDTALGMIAADGLDAFSLRDLAQAIGRSTTVIFNTFHTKAGVLSALAERAMAADEAFHQDFFAAVEGLALNRTVLRTLTTRYVLLRAEPERRFARLWIEAALAGRADPGLRDVVARWTAMRRACWTRVLEASAAFSRLEPVYFQYVVMEEIYANALAGRADYELLLQESLEALLDMAGGADPATAPISDWFAENIARPVAPAQGLDDGSLKLKLLDIAADQILEGGVEAVTNRSVSQQAETSTSSIPYHFGDMRRFLVEAVWHSVFREIPRYLDARRPAETSRPDDISGWADLLAPTMALDAEGDGRRAGFYVKYARLISQICLLAPRDKVFAELAMLLRGPEGGGTYARREAVWPPSHRLTRLGATRFALWIKGQALLDSAQPLSADPDRPAVLRRAADALVPVA